MTAVAQLHQAPHLSTLLPGMVLPLDPVIAGLELDSRRIQPGDLFLALHGGRTSGHEFIDQAIERGAAAVLWEAPPASKIEIRRRIPLVPVPDLRMRAGEVADRFYGSPSRELQVVGITGTNGKTSCCHFLAQALGDDPPVGIIGTLGHGLPGELEQSGNTTPDAVTVHSLLARFRERGARRAVMEVSSHALLQGRVQGVRFDTALFTNLSRDHLDYHGDMASYGAAKSRLFRMPGLRRAVINQDDRFGRELLESLPPGVERCGYSLHGAREGGATVTAGSLHLSPGGIRMEVQTPWGGCVVESPLLGRFNASNLLGVLAVLLVLGVAPGEAAARLGELKPVPGRMESFRGEGMPLVVVDYAHTPQALEQILIALREHGERLWCVFGCGGERDRGKRPLMGAVAARHADHLVITDDNPRGEDPGSIVADILGGVPGYADAVVCHDRAGAIESALRRASERDVVLVAGKGHERFQQVGGLKLPFSDREVVQEMLTRRGGHHG
ncbi:MAG TPA: UDP-N-acetylmuramoyl-L-alanyl-D-glutamate--2,6-diaminopimelate ligase [Gammaproteobacteria bacterium]|nr:UDP-N-acetylmuramoyl-L-alanyl-D-glutamate--2,6-diaminopimelate ligase [Gammaproteobacteria bacterium]